MSDLDKIEKGLKAAEKSAKQALTAAKKVSEPVVKARVSGVIGQVSYALEGVAEAREIEKQREDES